jgi:hypothetical protein
MDNDDIIVLNLIAEDPEDISVPAPGQLTDVTRDSNYPEDSVPHADDPQLEAERSMEHVTQVIMEATSQEPAHTRKETRNEGTVD